MGDTTGLDGSGAEDCAPLLNSNASSLRTTDVNLASLSKLGLTLCIPPLLVEVEVVSCLLSTLQAPILEYFLLPLQRIAMYHRPFCS